MLTAVGPGGHATVHGKTLVDAALQVVVAGGFNRRWDSLFIENDAAGEPRPAPAVAVFVGVGGFPSRIVRGPHGAARLHAHAPASHHYAVTDGACTVVIGSGRWNQDGQGD